MSTMTLAPTALHKIANAAYWLAQNQHLSCAWLDNRHLLNRGLSFKYNWVNPDPLKYEIVERLVDMLSVFNQRAYSVRYAHCPEFYGCDRFKFHGCPKNYEPSRADFIDALKQLNCLAYNLDAYAEIEEIKNAVEGLKALLISQIIYQSKDYNDAPWGR